MSSFRRWSVAAKAALLIGVLTVLGFVVAGLLIYQRAASVAREAALLELRAVARAEAVAVADLLGEAALLNRSLAQQLLDESKREAPDRERANALIRSMLAPQRQFVGMATGWEPQAFDQRDAEFVDTPLHDASGRYVPYFFHTASGVEGAVLEKYDVPGDGDYYLLAKASGREEILEPYVYPVDGKDVLMTTYAVPMMREGQFVGVVCADIALDSLQQRLQAVRIGETGRVRLLSAKGTVLTDPDSATIGKAFASSYAAELLPRIQSDQTFEVTDDNSAQVYVPIRVGDAAGRFVLGAELPMEELLAGARAVGATVFWVALVMSILVVGATVALLRRLVGKPLATTVGSVEALAAGRFDASIDRSRADEIGRLNDALLQMRGALQGFMTEQTEMSQKHAAGQLDHRIDTARYPGAFGAMAAGVNSLAEEHIGTSQKIVDVVQSYSRGDLAPRMPELPGEKRRITAAVEGVREKLLAIRDEILRLSHGAAAGEFDLRGDAQRFEFAFREMVDALNQLMANADDGLDRTCRVLAAVADGDLSRSIEGRSQGRFAQLQSATNATVARLREIVGEIQSAAGAINSAAGEIASGNADLSARTEQQAASLEETAASMEELTSTVRGNAENARSANQLAIGAGDVAERGGEVVRQVVTTMGEINAQSRKIEDIIGVIDGIAFQTNILALNAAVEAARAGEQGRGFAVVAGEVRTLAQRSAAAAREIKGLISETVQKVGSGSQLVDSAGATMAEILSAVKRVSEIMGEISAASAEQTAGIEQVSNTVTHMDETTQQNAALVEEATAAARAMEDQAARLAENVARFRL
ncbi:MAG: methyl-accepting chemotaxis protein [Lysobacterales bacterium]